MSSQGYYRFPDVHANDVIFVSEDDLWSVPLSGGIARRLTANLAPVSYPKISPNGEYVAYSALEEGHLEIYIMPSKSGVQKRLTFLGSMSVVLGWSYDSKYVYFCSNFETPFYRDNSIYLVSIDSGEIIVVPVGHANHMNFPLSTSAQNIVSTKTVDIFGNKIKKLVMAPQPCVLGRYTRDTSYWKRYRGGRTGEIWIDIIGQGEFEKLPIEGNVTSPMWIGDRIYFISDYEGIANIYSFDIHGKNQIQHTKHTEFYVRNASTDYKTIVYHAGADLYSLDIASGANKAILVDYASPKNQTNRKFIKAREYIQGYDIASDDEHYALVIRGKLISKEHWSGAPSMWGKQDGIARYRFPTWLYDNKTLLAISDEENGENRLFIVDTEKGNSCLLQDIPLGIVHTIFPSPKDHRVIITNHSGQMILIDHKKREHKILDTSVYGKIGHVTWHPSGNWLAYDFSINHNIAVIKLYDLKYGHIHSITPPLAYDFDPVFSEDGKYLYFVGCRVFYPVYDALRFDLSFIKTTKLYAITLKKDIPSPFLPKTKSPAQKEKEEESQKENTSKHIQENTFTDFQPCSPTPESNGVQAKKDSQSKFETTIDLDGIERRIVAFPIPVGTYSNIFTHQNKVFYIEHPRPCTQPDKNAWGNEGKAQDILKIYDLDKLEEETLIKDVTSYTISLRGTMMMVRQGNKLFVVKTGEKLKEKPTTHYTREDGEIDLDVLSVAVWPKNEWRQMFRESWILQREHFWTEDMSGVNWQAVYTRYHAILDRVGSRGEFSDLIWEMQGELGTSHCYEMGGDYRSTPRYFLGNLGCELYASACGKYYVIGNIFYGDSCDDTERSPLLAPGLDISPGDHILAIADVPLFKMHPSEILVDQAGKDVKITMRSSKGSKKKTRDVVVKTLKNSDKLLYRCWVEKNRRYVHEKSNGRLGYLHIPDMSAKGFAEFYRYYTSECTYDGLVVDVRFNAGGHVSQLLLETLSRKPIAYRSSRWIQSPYTYPQNSVLGPMIAITNQDAGSDGDIFSHAFKFLKLGKLIGKRTWGGVIGIAPQYTLVDGSVTTQPEYPCWFCDVGLGVENHGTVPDLDIDVLPKDYVANRDPQLDKAITLVLEDLQHKPPVKPSLVNLNKPFIPDAIKSSNITKEHPAT